jgi:hypothetical protein
MQQPIQMYSYSHWDAELTLPLWERCPVDALVLSWQNWSESRRSKFAEAWYVYVT